MKNIFLYLDENWRKEDSAASFLLTDQLGIKFNSDELVVLDDKDVKDFCLPFGAGIEAFAFIFSDEELNVNYKGIGQKLCEFESDIDGTTCQVSGLWEEGYVLVHYMVESLSIFGDQEKLLKVCLGDASVAETQYSYLGAVGIDHEEMRFHLALAEEYLTYLDSLVNYSEFRSKMAKTFDYVFTKINEFYLKAVKLKASIMEQFNDLKKVRSENPRAAFIVQSIYSGLNFDENTVEGDFALLDHKYENIRTFTKSINDSRQGRVAESLNTIMFWVAVISFFFGMIAFYDKYQSSETFNMAAVEAFTMTGFILLPFALLFIFVFMRNGVMFESVARILNSLIIRIKTSRSYSTLRWFVGYKKHVVDPKWAGYMEYMTTELVNGLLPQKMIAESYVEGRSDAEETIYFKEIKPRIRRTYHNLIKALHWKVNRLIDEKYSIKVRSRKQQFELIVSEICLFTVLNNWLLESNDIERDSELQFIDTVIMHSLYSCWIKVFNLNPDLISIVANNLQNYGDLRVQSLTARYLMDELAEYEEEELANLLQTMCEDSNYEYPEDLPGMVLSTMVEMDSPFWEEDEVPVYLPETYLDVVDSEDEESCSQIATVTNQSIPLLRDALWTLHIEDYLEAMEEELAKTECE